MILMTVQGLAKAHGLKRVFEDVSFGVEKGDRVGVIGANGSGKSTLLRVLAGIDPPDAGTIEARQDLRAEFLPQNPPFDETHSVLEHVFHNATDLATTVRDYERVSHQLERQPDDASLLRRLDEVSGKMDALGGWEYETRAKVVLSKLGVEDFDAPVASLSGGYRKRVALARVLVDPADLLILDEPTNHLDADTIAWLEDFLQKLSCAVILVTHDRYFLDRVVGQTLELDQGVFRRFEGNFSYYLEKRSQIESAQIAQEARRKNLLRKELAWLRRGAKAQRTHQKSRIDWITDIENTRHYRPKDEISFGASAPRLGSKVVLLKNIAKSFDGRKIISDFSYTIEPGQRLGIIGPNGCGKSTLANLIVGRLTPDTGSVIVGQTVCFGYYDQESVQMNLAQRAIDYVKQEGGEFVRNPEGKLVSAASALEQFLFTPQMMQSPIEKLSGGERRRLYLVRTLMKNPNFLILDEPTNDLDIATLEALEDFLDDFTGCLLVVSHDRYFIDRTVDQLIAFEGDGYLRTYPGNYSHYRQIRAEQLAAERQARGESKPRDTRKAKAEETALPPGPRKLSFNEQKELANLEAAIPMLEEKITNLERQMIGAATDYVKLNGLTREHADLKATLETDLARWEALATRNEQTKK